MEAEIKTNIPENAPFVEGQGVPNGCLSVPGRIELSYVSVA